MFQGKREGGWGRGSGGRGLVWRPFPPQEPNELQVYPPALVLLLFGEILNPDAQVPAGLSAPQDAFR